MLPASHLPRRQRLIQVGDEVIDVFNTNGEAHEAIGYAAALANFFGD